MGYRFENIETIKEVPVGADCDRCDKELELVFQQYQQAKDASVVQVQGWYGGFYDPGYGDEEVKMLLCGECSQGLFEFLGKERYDNSERSFSSNRPDQR